MLTTNSHFPELNIFVNGFQDDLLHSFLSDQAESGLPVFPWILLFDIPSRKDNEEWPCNDISLSHRHLHMFRFLHVPYSDPAPPRGNLVAPEKMP